MSGSLPVRGPVRFACTGCGACCKKPGQVYFTTTELQAMARHLDLETGEFRGRYRVTWDPGAQSHVVRATPEGPCPLLGPDDRCTVHPVKPEQCRTFPFWPELLDSEDAWSATKEACEGIDHRDGSVVTRSEIRALLRAGRERIGS